MSDNVQYFYNERSIKAIAEAIRSITNSKNKFKVSEMAPAIESAHPLILEKPEDLFEAHLNAQFGTANQCFRWGIFSKYPDGSYIATLDGYNRSGWTPSSYPVALYGMKFSSDFTQFIPYYRFNVSQSQLWNLFFTRQENNEANGIYLDDDGYPHIPADLPYLFPTKEYMGFNGNNGQWYTTWMGTDGYVDPSSMSEYMKGDALSSPVFNNRFKVIGASALSGKMPADLYSAISDGNWHDGITINQNILSFINSPTVPSGETISGAHWFNVLAYVDDVLKFGQYHCGPSALYLKDSNDHWRFNTSTKTFYNNNGNNLNAYYSHWRHTSNMEGYGCYPWNGGVNKADIDFSSYRESKADLTGWNHYNPPRSVDDLDSYIPFRTYDILDQDGNILLPANVTLADFGI